MALVPVSYNLRSLWVRRSATLLTVIGLGATVAVIVGILALRQGFESLYSESGQRDVTVLLRTGVARETESWFTRERADILMKSAPEFAQAEGGAPLASAEITLALRLPKSDGGETNVPVRGVQPNTFAIRGGEPRIVEGRRFEFGNDEVVVGKKLVNRVQDCRIGDTLLINVTPFRVVGVFEGAGPAESEIWGDLERISAALARTGFNRIIAKVRDDAVPEATRRETFDAINAQRERARADGAGDPFQDYASVPASPDEVDWRHVLRIRLEGDPQVPAEVLAEPVFLANQSKIFSGVLFGLVGFLATVMGVAAVFTAANTMLAALAARTKEVGILKSIGFRPLPIFASFLFESLLLGLFGGIVGTLLALPLNGIETGTTNWDTFTEVAFAFRITPGVVATAIVYALGLGLVGGAWPAWRAARMLPTEALRRG